MKVIHLSAEKSWRGGEQQIAYLHQELSNKNIEQLVVCKKGSAFEEYCIANKIFHESLPFKNQFDFSSSLKLKRIAEKFKADIIHIHSSHAHAIAVWAYYFGNKTNLVLSRKVDFKISTNFLSKIKYNCDAIKKVICVSNEIKQIMQHSLTDPSKCITIYDGIDLAKFKKSNKLRTEFNIADDVKIVASTAALADHKDYPTFLSAVEILKDKIEAKFFIIGDGPMKNEIESIVKKKNIISDVIFTGFRTDVNELMYGIDVFVLSSKTEGLGSSILDAYACNVPVACTNAGGIKEIATNEITALVSDIGDIQKLADNIFKLCNDNLLREKITNNAFIKVKEFDKSIMAEKTLSVYNEIISV